MCYLHVCDAQLVGEMYLHCILVKNYHCGSAVLLVINILINYYEKVTACVGGESGVPSEGADCIGCIRCTSYFYIIYAL